LRVRFLADQNLNGDIVSGVVRRLPEIDFETAYEAGLEEASDAELLSFAAKESKLLVTHDRKTMPIHFGKFIETQNSAGILIISQNCEIVRAIEELIWVWEASEAEEYRNLIRQIPL
jgi:predicted nuclease of predicted toxin-antitoxin system